MIIKIHPYRRAGETVLAACLLLLAGILPAAEPSPEERIARGAVALAANRLAKDREDSGGLALYHLAAAMMPASEDVIRIRLRLEKNAAPDPVWSGVDEEKFLLFMLARAEWLMTNRLEADADVGWTCLLYYLAADELLPESETVQVPLERLRALGYQGNLATLARRGTNLAKRGNTLLLVRPAGVPEDAIFHDGRWYKVYPLKEGATWEDARAACEALGGRLASIETWEKRRFLRTITQGRTLWVGARYHPDQRAWRWLSGVRITAWRQHDDVREIPERKGYHYLALVRNGSFENRPLDGRVELRRWQEGRQSATIEGVICEWGE